MTAHLRSSHKPPPDSPDPRGSSAQRRKGGSRAGAVGEPGRSLLASPALQRPGWESDPWGAVSTIPHPTARRGLFPEASPCPAPREAASRITFSTSWMCSCRSASVIRSTYHLSTLMRSLVRGKRAGGSAQKSAQHTAVKRRQGKGLTCTPGPRQSGSRCTCPSPA